MRVVSLFSGIGGLDKGFSDAGYDVVWANDFDKYAVETYKPDKNCWHLPQHHILIFPLFGFARYNPSEREYDHEAVYYHYFSCASFYIIILEVES